MKNFKLVLTMVLIIIISGVLGFNIKKQERIYKSNIVNVLEKKAVKNSKKNVSKKTTKKKTTKKKATKKKTTKKKTTKKKTVKRISNATIAELQAYARDLVINQYGWSEDDYNNLVQLWYRESGWNVYSYYKGCYGIPQAKPGNKMKSEGSDWKTNGRTQIKWGLKYIAARYGSPTKAWNHFQKKHWY